MKKKLISLAFLVALLPVFAHAQVTLIPTTLSSAITSSQTSITLAAVTGLNSNSYSVVGGPSAASNLWIDGELLVVTGSVPTTGTTINVARGSGGSRAQSHASGALVWVGPASFFFDARPGLLPGGSCTRTSQLVTPHIEVGAQEILDCVGGLWVAGAGTPSVSAFDLQFPATGAVLYTGVGTGSAGTAPSATSQYCTEINLPYSKNLTGMAVLNGGTAATDKWILALYDSAGNLLANTAVAGTTASGTNVYQKIAFTSTFYAVGPTRYFGCLQGNAGGSSTVTMIKTGMQDTILTKAVGTTTFGTLASFTPPTTFTTAVGPYFLLY